MTDSRIDLKSLTQAELSELLTDRGFPKYRAKQVMDWLQKGAVSADEMTNLPADLKNFIQNYCYISVSIIEKKLISRYDKTVKYLFSFADGECVEAVVMCYRHGYSIGSHVLQARLLHLHLHAGRLQNGMYLLRDGQKRLFALPDRLRNDRADRGGAA